MTPSSELEYREIPLKHGYIAKVDAEDYERVRQFNWHAHFDRKGDVVNNIYARRWFRHPETGKSRGEFLHRFVMQVSDRSIQIDHKEHDGLDCRKHMLRMGSQSDNQHNQRLRRDNKTGYKGVTKHRECNRWVSTIVNNGKTVYLGLHKTPEIAAKTYDVKAIELFGEFCHLNFPRSDYD